MNIVDTGQGPPLILVPGVQGRWEWMKPAVDALAARCRVITFSLADERSSGAAFDPARGLDSYVAQVRDALDQAGEETAAICGISYGSLVASAFAARYPERTAGLIVVSGIPPSWKPDRRVRFYLRTPRLLAPVFCIASVRLYKEIAAATPGVLQGVGAALRCGYLAATHMFSPTNMARRVRMLEGLHLAHEMKNVKAPVLVVTGEADLERVVPVHLTHEYLELWPHAQAVTLPRTGHLGLMTRPDAFAQLIAPFVEHTSGAPASRRRIG